MKGKVKFYNEQKGFGFITPDQGNDIFFHITDVDNQEVLKEGEAVKYDETQGDRGLKAIRVVKV